VQLINKMSNSDNMAEFNTMTQGSIVVFLLLIAFVSMGSYIEKHKVRFGHETGGVIILGFI